MTDILKSISSRRISLLCTAICIAGLGMSLLFYAGQVADAVADALTVCASVLIPALFPFMAFSVFVVRSGLSDTLSRFFAPVTRALFGLPGCTAATILTSFLGGYPAGARGIRALLDTGQITPREAERMTGFCVCAGPAFVISAVGARMLGSAALGVLLYAAQILAALAIGVAGRFGHKNEQNIPTPPSARVRPALSDALIASVDDAVRGMIAMCGLVCLCGALFAILSATGAVSALIDFLRTLGLGSAAAVLPSLVLEVTDACRAAAHAESVPAVFCALALGWGGLCVHLQVFSSLGTILAKGRFYALRMMQTALSALFTLVLLLLFPQNTAQQAFSTFPRTPLAETGQNGLAGAIALMAMAVVFLLSTSSKSVDFHGKRWYNQSRSKTKNRKNGERGHDAS